MTRIADRHDIGVMTDVVEALSEMEASDSNEVGQVVDVAIEALRILIAERSNEADYEDEIADAPPLITPTDWPWWRGRCREIVERVNRLDPLGDQVNANQVERVLMLADEIRSSEDSVRYIHNDDGVSSFGGD